MKGRKGREALWLLPVGFMLGACGLAIVIFLMIDEILFGGALGFR
jgi:hypothetical protein